MIKKDGSPTIRVVLASVMRALALLLLLPGCASGNARIRVHQVGVGGSDCYIIVETSTLAGGGITPQRNERVRQYRLRCSVPDVEGPLQVVEVARLPSEERVDSVQEFIIRRRAHRARSPS